MFSFLLEVITRRGELTKSSKLTSFAKRMLGAVVSEIDDWCRLLSGTVGVLARSKRVGGSEKKRRNTTYPNSKEEEKSHPQRTKPNS